jgi:hypothetical protein
MREKGANMRSGSLLVQDVPVTVWRAKRAEKNSGHKLHLKPEITFAPSPPFAYSREPFFPTTSP